MSFGTFTSNMEWLEMMLFQSQSEGMLVEWDFTKRHLSEFSCQNNACFDIFLSVYKVCFKSVLLAIF